LDFGRWSIAWDENLGKIHELVIDVKDGRLVYVVLSIGDFLGMVNKPVCLASESLRIPSRK
jgi:sporulation protein YlmC with PRC-barrel domain